MECSHIKKRRTNPGGARPLPRVSLNTHAVSSHCLSSQVTLATRCGVFASKKRGANPEGAQPILRFVLGVHTIPSRCIRSRETWDVHHEALACLSTQVVHVVKKTGSRFHLAPEGDLGTRGVVTSKKRGTDREGLHIPPAGPHNTVPHLTYAFAPFPCSHSRSLHQ